MKGTNPCRLHDLWLCDIFVNAKRQITTFTEAFEHQIWKTKKKKSEYVAKASCRKGIFLARMVGNRYAKKFPNFISRSLFLAEEVVVRSICHWVYAHETDSLFVDDISTKRQFE